MNRYILLLCIASYVACSADLEPVVVVRIPDVPSDVVSVVVESQLGSQAGKPFTVKPDQPGALRLGISVAASSTEILRLKLTGASGDDCVAAEGTLELPLAGASYPLLVDAPLSRLHAHRCTLTLKLRHSGGVSGRVFSQPAALDCTTAQDSCTYSFSPSTTDTLDLIAETDLRSYFTWEGSCQGNGSCKISLDRRRDEQIVFDPRSCLVPALCFHSPTPRDAVFTAISAAGADSAWAVGYSTGNTVARYADGRWILLPTGVSQPLRGVWTDPAGEMVAVGDQGVIVRSNGDSIAPVVTASTTKLNDAWGMDSSEVWAVGDSGTAIRIVGDTGYRIPTPVDNGPSLASVWGTSKDNVWAVGAAGTVLRWDGVRWTRFVAPDNALNYVSVFGSAPNDVWLLGGRQIYRWDGAAWRLVRQEQELLLRGFARSARDVWILRYFQRISTFNGVIWTRDIIPTASVTSVNSIAPAGDSGVWAAGTHGLITRGRDGFWTDTSGQTPSQNRFRLQSVWSANPDEAWACGSNILLHWNGRVWESMTLSETIDCGAIFGASPDDVWMLGTAGAIWHYDGSKWSKQQMQGGLSFLGGVAVSSKEAYAVGSGGTVLVWNGATWNPAPKLVSTPLCAAWAAAPNDIWVVGESGVILRGQGASFSVVPKPTAANFYAVRGTGPSDVHLLGAELWHWNGATFTQFPRATIPSIPSYVNLRDVVVWSNGTALAIGDFGTVLRYGQGSWTVQSYGDTRSLSGMAKVGSTDAWVVGDSQTILRYSP